ncbi:MAG: AAA family ATPase [Verrucomicrobia bacterium]|nr:AAA family ATPase [Verrucomicrobiota bacterium]
MVKHAYYIASTGQNVGKTTACLGLFSGLRKRFNRVGFLKPVGQEHIETGCGHHVDKDVILFKEHFELSTPYEKMSPVLFPSGFTRDFLDGKISEKHLRKKITDCFASMTADHDFTLLEGTGHTGVGSIAHINNAQVAALLQVPMILVASGGLGSAFDELSLNKTHCEHYGARVAGVILNRVLPDKREMVIKYMNKALAQWNIPLVGCIPYDSFLSNPTMKDFETLFKTTLLSGEQHRMRHFKQTRLVDTSLENYRDLIAKSQLIITPANREDIILETLSYHWDMKIAHPQTDSEAGMILTGNIPPKASIVEEIKKAEIPMLYAPLNSYSAMKLITSFTAKIRREDVAKVQEAIEVVENQINFDFFTKGS